MIKTFLATDLTIDTGVQELLLKARDEGIETAFDRASNKNLAVSLA